MRQKSRYLKDIVKREWSMGEETEIRGKDIQCMGYVLDLIAYVLLLGSGKY